MNLNFEIQKRNTKTLKKIVGCDYIDFENVKWKMEPRIMKNKDDPNMIRKIINLMKWRNTVDSNMAGRPPISKIMEILW